MANKDKYKDIISPTPRGIRCEVEVSQFLVAVCVVSLDSADLRRPVGVWFVASAEGFAELYSLRPAAT